jgi:ATP-dependent exoDNAse (exonuclease V) beta subunit
VAREYGTFVHAVLERVDLHRAVQADELAEIARGLAVDADLIRRLDATRLAAHANRVRAEYDDFSGAVLRAELPLSLLVDAATLPPEYWPDAPPPGAGEQVLVQGTVDLLAVWPERALVIDWKTGRATAAELRQRYSPQLAWYAAAVARLLPQLPRGAVRWLIAGVDSGELVTGGC